MYTIQKRRKPSIEETEDEDIRSANNKPKLDKDAQYIMEEIIKEEKENEHKNNVRNPNPSLKIPKTKDNITELLQPFSNQSIMAKVSMADEQQYVPSPVDKEKEALFVKL